MIFKKNFTFFIINQYRIFQIFMDNNLETNLIVDLRKGSVKAFNALYEIYFSSVYSYCMQISKSSQKANDITQDVFLKLWENRKRIFPNSPLKPFLFKIAKNQIISAYREAVNSKIYEDYILYTNNPDTEQNHSMEYEDFKNFVIQSINDLPKIEREVVVLSRLKMMKNSEIAAKLGLSEQTIKNRLVLGIKHLKELLLKYNRLILIPYILYKISII